MRVADIDNDALAIADGARDFANRVAFKSLFPKGRDFNSAIGRIMELDELEVLLVEQNGKVVGGLGIAYSPYLWNPSLLIGDELFWWTAKDAPFRTGRSLFGEAMSRINEKGAMPVFRSLETSPKGVERLYRSFGMGPVETVFMPLKRIYGG